MRLAVISTAMICILSGQSSVRILEHISFPPSFEERGFIPHTFVLNQRNSIYLDKDSRQIAAEISEGNFIFSGGFGSGGDALISPVDIAIDGLMVILSDKSENRVLQYDKRLNYLGSFIPTDPVDNTWLYPQFIEINPWGELLIYSEETHKVYLNSSVGLTRHINLDIQNAAPTCVSAMAVNRKGEIGLLYSCIDEVHIFNRLGQLLRRYKLKSQHGVFLSSFKDDWIVLNRRGVGEFLISGNPIKFPEFEQEILDVKAQEDAIHILTAIGQYSLVLDSSIR